jgi:hypothetical protein
VSYCTGAAAHASSVILSAAKDLLLSLKSEQQILRCAQDDDVRCVALSQ